MAANLGKVSFSFSKISKKPSLQVQPKETVKKVDKIEYIDSIENNSVQLVDAEIVEEKKPLIIPLQHPNLLIQSVIETVKSRSSENNDVKNGASDNENTDKLIGNGSDKPVETLEQMAARELIEDATKQNNKETESSTLEIPLPSEKYDKDESTLDDYENIPVNDFGLAMLRGMGWDPKKGIGKNGKIVKVAGPTVRPKGLGLGADKAVMAQKPVGKHVNEKEVLGKGSKVRVTVGKYKNLYGTVEGFDDDAGRINVFMAISNERVSMNECFVQLVTPDEFSKYSKVININAYNNYKEKESRTDNSEQQNDPIRDSREHTTSHSKYEKHDLDSEKYPKDSTKSTSSSHQSKKPLKIDSGSESDSHKYDKTSKSSSYKSSHSRKQYSNSNKHRSKKYVDSDDDKKRSKSKYESHQRKHSKKYSSDSDSSDDEKHSGKSRSKDSRRDKERRRSSSSDSDDYDRRRKHKKNKKKRDRSRSRTRR